MSYHILPDPHPGRCRNWRHDQHDPVTGQLLPRRCLKADYHTGACSFEPKREFNLAQTHSWHSNFDRRPEPWVVPEGL